MWLDMFNYGPEDLPDHDNEMITGEMGDCVSTIVLWSHDGRTYKDVRGWHGMGGLEAINFTDLFQDVPNTSTTLVLVIGGSISGSKEQVETLKSRVQKVVKPHLGAATFKIITGHSNVGVNRQGQCRVIVGFDDD